VVKHIKGLGCTISGVNALLEPTLTKEPLKHSLLVRELSVPLLRTKLTKACKPNPQYTSGAALSEPSSARLRSLRTATIRTLWGRGRAKKAPEMVLLALTDPTRADPECAVAVEAIVSNLRRVRSSPTRSQLLLRLRAKRVASKSQSHFPQRTLDAAVSDAGVISHPLVPSFAIINNNVAGIIPYLRELTRAKLLKNLKLRVEKVVNCKPGRTDFKQLPDAVDWNATMHLSRAKPSDKQRKALLFC
jgi:hypothetical protein